MDRRHTYWLDSKPAMPTMTLGDSPAKSPAAGRNPLTVTRTFNCTHDSREVTISGITGHAINHAGSPSNACWKTVGAASSQAVQGVSDGARRCDRHGFAWGRSVKGKVEVIGERAISVQAFRKVRWHLGRGARRSPGVDPTWEVGKPIGRTRSYDALPGSLARLRE